MACCPTKNIKFQLRRDTAIMWSKINPILLAGEPGYENDTNKMKIGDGINSWNNLPYLYSSGGGGVGPTGPIGPIGPEGPASIIVGQQGPTGPKGIDGSTSTITGPEGNTGPTGPTGLKGDKGDKGSDGAASTVAGPQGPTGLKGDQGNQGNPGLPSTVAGPTGPQGSQGLTGPKGDQSTVTGPTGPQGPTGSRADGVYVLKFVNSGSAPQIVTPVELRDPNNNILWNSSTTTPDWNVYYSTTSILITFPSNCILYDFVKFGGNISSQNAITIGSFTIPASTKYFRETANSGTSGLVSDIYYNILINSVYTNFVSITGLTTNNTAGALNNDCFMTWKLVSQQSTTTTIFF